MQSSAELDLQYRRQLGGMTGASLTVAAVLNDRA